MASSYRVSRSARAFSLAPSPGRVARRMVLPALCALSFACSEDVSAPNDVAAAPASAEPARTPHPRGAEPRAAEASSSTGATAPPAPPAKAGPLGIHEGSVFAKGSVHPIRWADPPDLEGLDLTVTIVESVDAGATWRAIGEATREANRGGAYFRWTVPSDGEHGRVGVVFHRTEGGAEHALRRVESHEVRFSPSQRRTYTWHKVTDHAPFGARDGSGGVVFRGKMWLIGGWNPVRFPRDCANDVWSSTDGATWIEEKPNTFTSREGFPSTDWEGRHFGGYHTWNGKMWIVGGDANQGHYQTDIWSSVDGRAWTRTDAHTTRPHVSPEGIPYSPADFRPVETADFGLRTAHVTGTFGGDLLVMGGQRIEQFVAPDYPGLPAAALDDVWRSRDGVGFTQVRGEGGRWAPRGFVSEAIEHEGRLWLIGGGLYDDPGAGRAVRSYFNDVWSTTDGARWSPSPYEAPFSPRIWHNVKAFDGRIWVINGYDGDVVGQGRLADNLRDVWYSTNGNDWYDATAPEEFVPRHAGTAWVHQGELFVGSGNAITTEWVADVWKLSPR